MLDKKVPTLFEWMGGQAALEQLMNLFYDKVRKDALIGPIFKHMSAEHPQHVARFVAEVLGGPKTYSLEHGGHPAMIEHHLQRHLTGAQRSRWMQLLLESADDLSIPDDPEFRSSFVAYLEWGSRLAVINSQEGATVNINAPMPQWGWGETGGPYQASSPSDVSKTKNEKVQ
jgi:hemoglobin